MRSIIQLFERVMFYDPKIGRYIKQQTFTDKRLDLQKQKEDIMKRFRERLKNRK